MKFVSVVLAIMLILSMGVFAFADEFASTGLSVHSSSDSEVDDPGTDNRSPATETDAKELIDDESLDDAKTVIYLESGSVRILDDSSDGQGSAIKSSSSSRSVDTTAFGYYIDVSSSAGSRIYVPADYAEDSFYVNSDGDLYGMRSNTIQCYTDSYYVRFPAYSSPQYRPVSGSSYTWSDLDISYEDSPNVEVLGARMNWFGDRFQALIGVAALAFLIILVLRRK